MNETSRKTTAWLLVCMILLLLMLAGCATPMPDVGRVVIAPKVHLPPLPKLVQETSPMPAGFYQQTLADYFSVSPQARTESTPLMPAAGPGLKLPGTR